MSHFSVLVITDSRPTEKDKDAWTREFKALLDGLPGDACLSVVDCHI